MKLDLLTIDMFSDKVGQIFTVEQVDAPPVALTLIEVTPITNYAKAERAPFSLIFTSQGVGVLPQRMYDLRHASLGLQSIFLVPIRMKADVVSYQSIFN